MNPYFSLICSNDPPIDIKYVENPIENSQSYLNILSNINKWKNA